MSVKLWRYKYIATQWPCPEWFHVPTKDEWVALCWILTSTFWLASNATTMGTYLKMPKNGMRNYTNAEVYNLGSYGQYWSSTPYGASNAYYLDFGSSYIYPQTNVNRAYGYVIRPFYNEWIAPNWGWQVLYQWTGSAWIYWQKDLWLITASGNGVTWYTIADKNLWATKVYNSWDTLSEENYWWYYQWWNNHMFPLTWTVTTSSTQVNASSYWPGNWYNSSTFITNWNWWDSSYNANLWWWVNWNVWKDVESICGLPSEYQEVEYIASSWTQRIDTWVIPTQNTISQIKFRNLASTWNVIYWMYNWNDSTDYRFFNASTYAYFDMWSGRINNTTSNTIAVWTDYELELWNFYVKNLSTWTNILSWTAQWSYTWWRTITLNYSNNSWASQNRWYYVKIRDWQTQVRYFIPCYRKSDNVIWLYDLVEWTFYTNQGTWTFTKGNDVSSGMDIWEHQLDEHSMPPQWPAPDGFHIPTSTEWEGLCGILTTTFWLASNATTMGTYLKMPLAGSRNYYYSDVNSVGNISYYWTSTPAMTDAYNLYINSSNIYPQNLSNRAGGNSVRCFKNTSVIPTSSWTTLYQGTWSAWVFWNNTDGLISVSWDGINWYTIMDKNLWATIVYNQWDTLTDANCGYFYQWGNNYWFAHSWTLTTSSTRVDASWYGPWNYYSSSTFIVRSTDWSSVKNNDLWWWVSKVESKHYYSFNLLNEYIWEYHECEVNTMGPCPSGFHIPTRQEWHDLYDIWYALWLWDTTNYWRQLQLQFNIPVCWKLNNDWTYTSSPTDAVYWCADKQSSSYWRDVWLRTTTDAATIDDDTAMIRWGSIRPFRNMPLIPTTSDSNWSIPSGSNPANGWIYDNETEWVISISADWAHWMTLADKNCWATTKWYLNSTMSEANCWKFYQWGNNHWFPFTWATKTSSTAVDASDYWPFSEYYDDDTFITTSPWDTSDNRNLWGWVSWPTRNCDLGWWWSLWPSTVVCDFRSWASWEATPYSVLVANNNFVAQRSWYNSISQWNNWTLRLTIPRTDYAGAIKLWWWEAWWNWISNAWYNTWNTSNWVTSLKQNLIKKAYLTVSAISSTSYPNFWRAWVYIDFCKKVVSSNISNDTHSVAWFVFPRSNYSSYSWYQIYPSDVDVKYLVLPSTPNIAWNWTTCSDYINQWVTSIGSKVIIETRWSSPSNLHYWLTIEVTWNEYDLWLCSDLWACIIAVDCWDWWQNWSYKEISEAYLEMYDSWYIDYDWNITDTKPW